MHREMDKIEVYDDDTSDEINKHAIKKTHGETLMTPSLIWTNTGTVQTSLTP